MKIKKLCKNILTVLFFALGTLFCWLIRKWNSPSINQLTVTFLTPQIGTDSATKIFGFINFIIPAVIVSFLIFFMCKKGRVRFLDSLYKIGIVFFLIMLMWTCANFKIFPFQRKSAKTVSSLIDDEIIKTTKKNVSFPWKKRNLILIFLESMEITYSDEKSGGTFDDNLIPNLTAIAQDNICFSNNGKTLNGGIVLPCCDNTISGIFAQTSALPLKINSENDDIKNGVNFFEGLMNLGDLLKSQKYNTLFACGSDARFSGTDLYFRQHGDYRIKDYVYAKENEIIPENYRVWWGYEDAKLLPFIKNELLDLQKQKQPFNLIFKTVDTHKEDGYVCSLCKEEFEDNQYANVVHCSDRQISDFIEWCEKQDFYNNTTIIILGDHLTMDSDFCDEVPEDYVRKTYVSIINPHKNINRKKLKKSLENSEERQFSTLDLFPTILASIGCKVKGNRLGLGVNLFSDEKTLVEKYGIDLLSQEIVKKSRFISELQKGDR